MNMNDVMKWTHFLRRWPFVGGINRSLVDCLHRRPVMRSFDVFFDGKLNKLLNKQSKGKLIQVYGCSFDVTVTQMWETFIMWTPDTKLLLKFRCVMDYTIVTVCNRSGNFSTVFHVEFNDRLCRLQPTIGKHLIVDDFSFHVSKYIQGLIRSMQFIIACYYTNKHCWKYIGSC